MLSLPLLFTVMDRVTSLRLERVVLAWVGKPWPAHRPRVVRGHTSLPALAQLLLLGLDKVGVSQHTSTSLVSEQTWKQESETFQDGAQVNMYLDCDWILGAIRSNVNIK